MGTKLTRRTRPKTPGPPNSKWCPTCLAWKNNAEFYKDKSRKDGLGPYCKTHADAVTYFQLYKRQLRKRKDISLPQNDLQDTSETS